MPSVYAPYGGHHYILTYGESLSDLYQIIKIYYRHGMDPNHPLDPVHAGELTGTLVQLYNVRSGAHIIDVNTVLNNIEQGRSDEEP